MADSDELLTFRTAPEAPAGCVPADAYRAVTAGIVRPVGVLICQRAGRAHGITVDSFLDVSYDPPTVAVSVYAGSRMIESLEAAQTMTLSLLSAGQKGIAQWLGEPGQPLYGVLDAVPTATAPSGVPYVRGALGVFDCRIVERLEVATHTLVVGAVTAVGASGSGRPLARWQDDYGSFAPRSTAG